MSDPLNLALVHERWPIYRGHELYFELMLCLTRMSCEPQGVPEDTLLLIIISNLCAVCAVSQALRRVMADAAGSPVSGSAFPDELDDGLVKEPITEAVMSNRVERVQQLLSVDPEKIGMRKPTYYGRTLLMLAAEEGHMDVARLLVERGADPNAVDDQENTALHCAALAGRVDLLAYLLGLGVDPIAQNNLGRTALMRAAWGGHVPVIEALIAHPEPVGLNMQVHRFQA